MEPITPARTTRYSQETRASTTDSGDPTISGASKRLRALAALSGSLTDALNPDEAAKLVEEQALSALGATSAVVVTLGHFPPLVATKPDPSRFPPKPNEHLYLVHAIGLPLEIQSALQDLPLDAPIPMAEVAREGKALFLQTIAEMNRYGEWGASMVLAGAEAAAVVPVWANGELRGVLGLAWPGPQKFDEDERAFVLTLGVMCAQAILRSHLRAAEATARESAERANQSKANFLAMISHELRTPMNAVIGYSEIISRGIDGPVTPLQSDHLERMQRSGNHLLQLIEELLGFARLEAGQDHVALEQVQLSEIVDYSITLIRPLAAKKGLNIRVEMPDKPVELYTDSQKLRQILVNLLGNAIKFTELGNVDLIVRVEGVDAAIRIVFEVTDTGIGISDGAQEHLFEAFWQQDPASPLNGGGTGLGLPIARQLARLLGGEVILEKSSEGKGSTFIVSMPLRYSAENVTI